MAVLAAIGAGLSIASSASEAEDQKAMGAYQKQQFEFNQGMAELQAKDAIKRGEVEVNQIRSEGKKIRGSQRAALAAQGIQIDSGSAAVIQADSEATIAQDMVTAKNNAWREAWGYKAQALTYGQQGRFSTLAADSKARNTLLAGGIQAIGYGAQAYGSGKGKR